MITIGTKTYEPVIERTPPEYRQLFPERKFYACLDGVPASVVHGYGCTKADAEKNLTWECEQLTGAL